VSILLGWHVVDVDGCVLLELEPVAAAAPLVLAGDQPHPLDGRVALLARAADHSVLVEGVDDDGVGFGALKVGPVDGAQEEGILEQ